MGQINISQTPHRGPVRSVLLIAGLMLPLALTAACGRVGPDSSAIEAAQAKLESDQAEAARVAAAVQTAMQADAATASIANDSQHAAAMRAIDTSTCPPEFRAAYLEHIFAWERYAKIQRAIADLNSDDSVGVTVALSALNGLLGGRGTPILDHIQAAQQLETLREEARDQIHTTFERVEVVATGFGAPLPTP